MAGTPEPQIAYEGLTRDELVARLRALEAGKARTQDAESRTLYDLEVHQVELEMQNQELRAAYAGLEEARERFRDLYDFAPIAYVTLGQDARITEANLTAASLFGIERGKLIGKFLTGLVEGSDARILREHISRCFEARAYASSARSRSTFAAGPPSSPTSPACRSWAPTGGSRNASR